jgi:Icc-related predicted phosphoesterase
VGAIPKIYFCGDVHGRFDHLLDVAWRDRPDALVLLGDIQAQRPLEQELTGLPASTGVWFIHGNHDTDSVADHDHLWGSSMGDRSLHGKVQDVCGVRIAGLGGVFRGRVWSPPRPPAFRSEQDFCTKMGAGNRWRGGLPLKHRSTIFADLVDAMKHMRADVLVTHEAPGMHPFGFAAIDDLAASLQVKAMFHGHMHEDRAYGLQPQGFDAWAVGLRGVFSLNGGIVLPGQTEHPRDRS